MRKPLPIQISIPEPCHENWDAMTPAEQGRFCSKCQKCVTDFTGWTDSEIYNYISKNSGQRICGRLHSTQLNRPIQVPAQPHSRHYQYFLALGLTLLTANIPISDLKAQTPYTYTTSFDALREEPITIDSIPIYGQVLDENKEPIIGAVVRLMGDGISIQSCLTDTNGYFNLMVSAETKNNTSELAVSYVGYKELIHKLTYQDTHAKLLFLLSPAQKMGLMEVGLISYKVPLMDKYSPGTGQTFTAEQMEQMAH